MPIPFIVGGIALAAGATGIKKGIDAKSDMDSAKYWNVRAKELAEEAEFSIERSKKKTKITVEELGREKIRILSTSMTDFVTNFEKIKNINFSESEGLNELKNFKVSQEEFKQLKSAAFEAKDIAVNGLSAIGSGALVAYGTYGAVMGGYVGALASTGTAIGSLSGVAATNATLAWLGGGSLAAGGYGMAGGMVVLGGLVAGPAIAIGGTLMASKAKKALNDAYSNYDEAEAFKTQADSIAVALKGIRTRADQLTDLLEKLDVIFTVSVRKLSNIISTEGVDWASYSTVSKNEVYRSVQIAKTIKIVLDTQLLKQDGKLDEKSREVVETGQKYLTALKNT
jgi:hypothetical protein